MSEPVRLYALMAEFDRAERLLEAVKRARKRGLKRIEAFSPFPIEGMAEALGFEDHVLAPAMLAGAILGGVGGFALQVYANLAYPLNVGGRPLVAAPAFTLITFELLVLGAVLAVILTMLIRNRLPRLHHPLFEVESFHFATDDKFFLAVMADDPGFDRAKIRRFLTGLHPVLVAEAPITEPDG